MHIGPLLIFTIANREKDLFTSRKDKTNYWFTIFTIVIIKPLIYPLLFLEQKWISLTFG